MGETDITELITRLTLETSQFVSAAQNHMRLVDTMKAKLRELATTANVSFKDASKGLIDTIRGWGDLELKKIFPTIDTANMREVNTAKNSLITATRQATTELNKENKELKDNADASKKASLSWGDLGNAMKLIMGLGIIQFLRQVWQLLVDSTKSAFDFVKATYMLATGANALRRAGVDISLRDMYENLDKLQKKFGVFSKKELVEGASAFMNLVRDMGFTKEQIFELQNAVATLAIVNGRAMDDVQRTVALALSSGYTEGLQRLGVSINRVNIALKAEELGYGRVYMTLTEAQRAEATQLLLLEKTAKYADDAAKYQGNLAGQIQTSSAAIIDQKVALGEELLPLQRTWNEVVSSTITVLEVLFNVLGPIIRAFSDLWSILEKVKYTFNPKEFWTQNTEAIKEATIALLRYTNAFYGMFTGGKNLPNLEKLLGGPEELKKFFGEALEEAEIIPVDKAQQQAERLEDIMKDLATQLYELQQEKDEKILEAEQDFQNDLAKIDEDGAKKRLDIWADFNKKISDIGHSERMDLENARSKYALDVAQANRQANIRLSEANARYREQQIKEEINYQEQLKKIREGFLINLEDALRERDALAVLRATRQYNLQKKQATREHEINIEEMRRAHALELQELENARQERLRVLREELNARILAIQAEAQYKREQARIDRDAKLAELAQELIDEAAARKAKHDQELVDIEAQAQEKTNAIIKGLVDQYDLSQPELEKIASLWESIYGPGGRIPKAFEYTIKYIIGLNQALSRLSSSISSLNQQNYNFHFNPGGGKGSTGQAAGGINYADRATSLTFGEAGPEMAITMPLTRAFSGNQYINGMLSKGGSAKKGNMEIQLLLSPDLVARVVRQSGDMVATVLMEVQRQK